MQLSKQMGRDDTIDPYYLLRVPLKQGGSSDGTNVRYTLARSIDDDGTINYSLVELDGTSSKTVGTTIVFSAKALMYDTDRTVETILNWLISKDTELQENLTAVSNSIPYKQTTFDELGIDTSLADLSDIIVVLENSETEDNLLISGELSHGLPESLQSANIEIKTMASGSDTLYEATLYGDVEPYKWTALYKNNTRLLDWTPAYGGGDAITLQSIRDDLNAHINNTEVHITNAERARWDEHVSVTVSSDKKTLIFSN